MSMSPRSDWGRPGTRFARKIAPAQVPHTGMPARARARIFSVSPYRSASRPIVVLSPPGMMSASTSSSCSGFRTSRPSAPIEPSTSRCSRKSPWSPRTPTRRELPAADGEPFTLGDPLERDAAHRHTEAARHVGDELRVGVVRRCLHDRARDALRVLGLENPGPDEVSFRAELHRQRGVGRRRDPAGAEEDYRQLRVLRDLLQELDRNAVLLRSFEELTFIQCGQLLHRARDGAEVAHGLDDVAGPRLTLAADHRGTFVDPA